MMIKENFYILTGAPGTGKTSLIRLLKDDYQCVSEPAREVIAQQRAIQGNGTSDRDPKLFVDLLLSRSIQKYTEQKEIQTPVIFDRGIPDIISYASSYNFDVSKFEAASQLYRYNKYVFYFSPWKLIYTTDEERRMTFDQTVAFDLSLKSVYEQLGYNIIDVPFCSLEDRVKFIRARIIAE